MLNKKNLPLYIALAVPVLMILLVAGFIYLPGLSSSPKSNFLYMTGNNVYYDSGSNEYQVQGGHLVHNPIPVNPSPSYYQPPVPDVHFYVYDVVKKQAQEISFEQAQTYNLDSSNTSADGYIIQQGNGSGGNFLFGGSGDYTSWFIKGHNRSQKLNLKLTGTYYGNFQFLGWVN